ncbi:MAG: DNA mismatch repair endonuclease MutL [Candidatus Gracilibacteria bacterium]
MSIIKILPDNLVNQIAAGEVIERPASVVKELVENSIDAGSTGIVIEIKDAGKTLIKVTDNGFGMTEEDLQLALKRHATSKISDEKDLWNIHTMGFRGEAVPSISSVSQFTIRSKTKDDLAGFEINCDGGEIVKTSHLGMNVGTCVEVRSLFFNTPARQKYLKQDSTEIGHTTALLNTIALAHPEISFKLIHNDKVIFDLAKSTDLISRVADVFGKATSDAMLPIFYGGSDFKVDGFIGKPLLSRSTTQHQYFFVNKRPIQHFVLANTIREAFHSMLMENKKPVFIVNINIDPSLVDVNVHPRKLEVRFVDQQALIRTMYNATKVALEKNDLTPMAFTESQRYMSDSFPKNITQSNSYRSPSYSVPKNPSSPIQDALSFTKNFLKERDSQSLQNSSNEEHVSLKSISQISNSYIVAESSEGLVLIDQHAAHERVRYEELMNQFENENKSVQPLLVPAQMEFTDQEALLIEENIGIFTVLGFDIQNFGGRTFIINAVPSFLSGEDIDEVVKGVLDDIVNEKNPTKFQGKSEAIINYMSCRSAIKFGQKLTLSEMQALIMKMEKLQRPYTCPHGRPTMIKLTLSELERMFGRK